MLDLIKGFMTKEDKIISMETGIGFLVGILIIWAGYLVRTKKALFILVGYLDVWRPVNEERLGNRIGNLLMFIGFIAIGAAVLGIWFSTVAVGKISGMIVLGVIVFIIIAIGLDQMGR